MSSTDVRVIRVGREGFDDVVDVLCDAFHDYEVMRFVLRDAGEDYEAQVRELIAYFTDSRVSRGWPVLAAAVGDRIVGAANVNPPGRAPAPPSLERRYERLCERLGDAAIERFRGFADACESLEPAEPHYFLGMIGVRRALHGRGVSRPLMDAVHALSERDPASSGVLLTTETQRNLPFYQHFGYRIVGRTHVEELTTWALFRPDPASPG